MGKLKVARRGGLAGGFSGIRMGWLVGKEGAEWGAELGRRSVKSVKGDGGKAQAKENWGNMFLILVLSSIYDKRRDSPDRLVEKLICSN